MCDYCDCRSRNLIAALGQDHDQIRSLMATVRFALAGDDWPAAAGALAALAPHSELEEGGLYRELADAGVPTDGLYAEHASVDSTIAAAADPTGTQWRCSPWRGRRVCSPPTSTPRSTTCSRPRTSC